MSILILDAVGQIHAGNVVLVSVHQLCMKNRVLGLTVPLPLEVDVIRGFGEIMGAPCEFTCKDVRRGLALASARYSTFKSPRVKWLVECIPVPPSRDAGTPRPATTRQAANAPERCGT